MKWFCTVFLIVAVSLFFIWKDANTSKISLQPDLPGVVRGEWRYRMTVAIETPESERIGTTVRQVGAHAGPSHLKPFQGGHASVTKGEAVVIDLGDRGVVFALMRGPRHGVDYGGVIPFTAFPADFGGLTPEGIAYYSTLKAGPVELAPENYPQFVYFRDMGDPTSVENLIDYASCDGGDTGYMQRFCIKNDRFAEVFGEGVRLKSVTIEMTESPATTGLVLDRLPWLPSRKTMRGTLGGGDSITHDPTGTWLTGSEFLQEILNDK